MSDYKEKADEIYLSTSSEGELTAFIDHLSGICAEDTEEDASEHCILLSLLSALLYFYAQRTVENNVYFPNLFVRRRETLNKDLHYTQPTQRFIDIVLDILKMVNATAINSKDLFFEYKQASMDQREDMSAVNETDVSWDQFPDVKEVVLLMECSTCHKIGHRKLHNMFNLVLPDGTYLDVLNERELSSPLFFETRQGRSVDRYYRCECKARNLFTKRVLVRARTAFLPIRIDKPKVNKRHVDSNIRLDSLTDFYSRFPRSLQLEDFDTNKMAAFTLAYLSLTLTSVVSTDDSRDKPQHHQATLSFYNGSLYLYDSNLETSQCNKFEASISPSDLVNIIGNKYAEADLSFKEIYLHQVTYGRHSTWPQVDAEEHFRPKSHVTGPLSRKKRFSLH